MNTGPMIEAEGLAKHYGETRALAGVDFAVPAGTILGLLGPNRAGKTTAVRILTTLALPDAGRATVAGMDVVKHPGEVRRQIGVAAQDTTLDALLTGRQNLVMIGELSGTGRAASRARAAEAEADRSIAAESSRETRSASVTSIRRATPSFLPCARKAAATMCSCRAHRATARGR
ncbi:MAG TPA: ATP-binding cassette domain-containing protein [Solirubrobacteraceae bacterium]